VTEKKQQIAAREDEISEMNDKLSKKLKELNYAYKHQKMTQKKYESQISKIKGEHNQRLTDLQRQQMQAQEQLKNVSTQLAVTEGALSKTESEKKQLAGKLAGAEKGYAEQVAKMKSDFEAQRGQERAAFEAEMNKQKLSASERAGKEAAYRAGIAKKERELNDKIAGLSGKLAGTEAQLAKARAEMEARKNVAKEIQQGFAKAGVKAEVDGETGDVTLDFGDHYFDSGHADIKPEMAKILQKALPIYAKSLMENKKISGKINNIEIIGFASPTYQGRFIDPTSMSAEDKKAVEYNLDLSYQRAKSIFQYVFDTSKMQYTHQKEIRPMVKVSGKSFFEAAKISRDVASANAKDFCKKYDCKKSQRVLIKFNVDQK
jgi:outer membrane protein OmpA-like peptidoglycan-associated protein